MLTIRGLHWTVARRAIHEWAQQTNRRKIIGPWRIARFDPSLDHGRLRGPCASSVVVAGHEHWSHIYIHLVSVARGRHRLPARGMCCLQAADARGRPRTYMLVSKHLC